MVKRTVPSEKQIEIGLIDEPTGIIRLEIDPEKINELAESVRIIGQLQAILVRPVGTRYEIIYGHRRFLACQKLGMSRIRATVSDLDDATAALMRATENIAREDISPIEEAAVYADLRDNHGLSHDRIGERMGKSPSVIKRRLDLLKMPSCLQKAVHKKQISYSVAEDLWSLGDLHDIEYLLQFAVDHGATSGVVRQWVKEKKDEKRRMETGAVRSTEGLSPMEKRPIFVGCDICLGPMELGSETVIRACPACTKLISEAVKGGE